MNQEDLPREAVCPCGDGARHSAMRTSGRAYECLLGSGIVVPFPRPPEPEPVNHTITLDNIELHLGPAPAVPEHVVFA